MTLMEDLEIDCCEEELSETQVKVYNDGVKEYEKAMAEANQIKKEGLSVTKNGNIWLVKSTYQVKVRNTNPPASSIPQVPPTTMLHHPQIINQSVPNTVVVSRPPNPSNITNVPAKMQILRTPGVNPPAPAIQTVEDAAFPASQLLSQFTAAKKVKTSPFVQNLPGPQVSQSSPVQVTQPIQVNQPMNHHAQPVQAIQSTVQVSGAVKKTTQLIQPNKPSERLPSMASPPINQQMKTITTSFIPSKKNVPTVSPEDPKMLSKTIPSLCVVVRPANSLPDSVNAKKREGLDAFVKSRLVLDPRRFAEWLMQVGLLRSQQFGLCRTHMTMAPTPLQLRMYAEESRFPHSGGYVWITKCCDRNFVSIFRESIFEDSTHPPAVLLKLIYHWACQTTVANVVQWVKIDHPYLRLFYAMLRSVCTVELHTCTPLFGCSSKNGRVEVGVISLGTTSTDGQRRDVKVEVLGVYDQETQKLRLRASEPITGDGRSCSRFTKILEPLSKWVNSKAIILTDYTVERKALEDLGFRNVVQKNLSTASAEDRLTNRNIMDYLRKTVPKVFQNTLSVLSTATIQQFLDELVWRETNGESSADAFHNIIRDLSSQARAETGLPLVKRLPLVSVDPFKDWSIVQVKPPHAPSNETTATSSGGIKRSSSSMVTVLKEVPQTGPSNPKEMRTTSYYATMIDPSKEAIVCDPKDAETFCQHSNCQKLTRTNVEMMMHMRQHLVKDVGDKESVDWNEHCNYCLDTLSSVELKKQHEEAHHSFLSSFKIQKTREDSAVIKEIVCLICHQKFPQYRLLEQHLEQSHSFCEMPYRCRVCHFQTSVHAQLINHFFESHSGSSHLLCPVCLDTFSTKGDNLAQEGDTGHMQYLQHLKTHFPLNKGHRCKRCVLTFQQYEQLRYHVRTDHISGANNTAVRPFTFTVIKPIGFKVGPATPTVTYAASPITTPPSIPVEVVSPTTGSFVRTAAVASGSGKAGLKTYAKDLSQDIPNTSVARKLANVTLTEETQAVGNLCIECKEPLKKKAHFGSYLCCTLCRFSSCCSVAMKQHQNHVHKGKPGPILGSVFALSETVECKCGFTSNSGLEVERHMIRCGQKSVNVAP